MKLMDKNLPAQTPILPVRLARDPYRTTVEKLVSEHTGHQWRIKAVRDMAEFACHPCAILKDESYSVFVKFSEAANGAEQFEIELAGLRLLSERAGILIPTPIGVSLVEGGSILLLEAVQEVERGPNQWRQIGQTLARIHNVKGEKFGLKTSGYFGAFYQDNTPMDDWPTFFSERRLWPGLRLAIGSGNMPADLIRQIEKLILRIPDLCGPEVAPTLLHGDAQQNNFISTEMGAVVIDPAVYYGNPEMDLAFIDYFQAAPEYVVDGYQEILPIDPGFWERRDLWRIWGYLACVTVEGQGYVGRLREAVQKYL